MNLKSKTLACLAALVGTAYSSIAGLSVVQEARIDDPISTNTQQSLFGNDAVAYVGDYDGDGVGDVIAGASRAHLDSGSLVIALLTKTGKQKGESYEIASRTVQSHLTQVNGQENWGKGLAVLQAFDGLSQPCAIIMTKSADPDYGGNKVWTLKICRDAATGNPSITKVAVIDETSPAFAGIAMQNYSLGNAMSVIDTLLDERIVALGSPEDGTKSNGRVIIVAVDLTTFDVRKVAVYPDAFSTTDKFGTTLSELERFGTAIAPLRGINGSKGMAVVSRTWKNSAGSAFGRIHLITFDDDYQYFNDVTLPGSPEPITTSTPFSIATGDFDHDQVTDLVVGYRDDGGGSSPVALRGAVRVALMNKDGSIKDESFIRKGDLGLVDTANQTSVMITATYFGAQVVVCDFDRDNQLDLIVGSQGNAIGAKPRVLGGIWPLRLKQKPWLHKQGGILKLTGSSMNFVNLSEYVTGNDLTWSVAEISSGQPSRATCSAPMMDDGDYHLECIPKLTNGSSNFRVTAKDNDNLQQELLFTVEVSGLNEPPVRSLKLPNKVVIQEDRDSAVLDLRAYYSDPDAHDGDAMTFSFSSVNGSVAKLMSVPTISTDSLRLKPFPLHFGLCTLEVKAMDPFGAYLVDTLVVEIRHVNHPPQALRDEQIVKQSTPVVVDVKSNDAELDAWEIDTVSVAVPPRHGKAEVQKGMILYTPDSFFLGIDSLRYKLSDDSSSSFAWLALSVGKTNSVAVVYRAMRDTTVSEGAPPIVIKLDSLFFSGASQFGLKLNSAQHDCSKLAEIVHDPAGSSLTLKPLPYQNGSCQVWISTSSDGGAADSIRLKINPVLNPYSFPKKDSAVEVDVGSTYAYVLDQVDLDRDTLEYKILSDISETPWVIRNGFKLWFKPEVGSKPKLVTIEVRKKALKDVEFLDPTDTLSLYVVPVLNTGLKRRIGEGVTIVIRQDRVAFLAGSTSIRVELFTLHGKLLVDKSAAQFQAVELECKTLPNQVYLRLVEGHRVTTTPLYLHP